MANLSPSFRTGGKIGTVAVILLFYRRSAVWKTPKRRIVLAKEETMNALVLRRGIRTEYRPVFQKGAVFLIF